MKLQFTSNYQSVFLLHIRNSWNVQFIKGNFFTGGKKPLKCSITLHTANEVFPFYLTTGSKGQ